MSFARELLKVASASHGAGLSLGSVLRAVGKGTKHVVHGAGEFGAGVAQGVGVAPELGYIAGAAVPVAAGASQASAAKRKVDEWRYRHGLYSGY